MEGTVLDLSAKVRNSYVVPTDCFGISFLKNLSPCTAYRLPSLQFIHLASRLSSVGAFGTPENGAICTQRANSALVFNIGCAAEGCKVVGDQIPGVGGGRFASLEIHFVRLFLKRTVVCITTSILF